MGLIFTVTVGCGAGFKTKRLPAGIADFQSNDSISQTTTLASGASLYAKNCQGCHGSLATTSKQNRKAFEIRTAINTRPAMMAVPGLKTLSDRDLQSIADALDSSLRSNPFICTEGSDPSPGRLRRLTKREYTATLRDLLGSDILANLTTQLDQLDTESIKGTPVIDLFDTTNPVPVSMKLILAFEAVASRAADLIAANSARMNSLAGSNCISSTSVPDSCVNTLLDNFGAKAHRRPMTVDEKTRYLALYRTGTSPTESFARVITAILQAPAFLYHLTDQGTPLPNRIDVLVLTPYEIASKLSYTITGTMPDNQLFEAARTGALATSSGVQQQAERLFNLANAKGQVREFYSQWLGIQHLPAMTPPADVSAGINVEAFRSEAKQEVIDIMDEMIWNRNANYGEILSTRLIAPRGPALATVYGVGPSTGLIESTDANREGILTRPGLLAKSLVGASDPVRRGVQVRIHMLCDTLSPPPADAESSGATYDPLDSTRNRIAAKTSPTNCMSCHSRINGLGFTFEHFDGFGRYRTSETVQYSGQSRVHTINAVAEPNINSPMDPPVDGVTELQRAMVSSTKGPACLAIQYYRFQTGGRGDAGDDCSLSNLYSALSRTGGSLKAMMQEIVNGPFYKVKKLD